MRKNSLEDINYIEKQKLIDETETLLSKSKDGNFLS